MSQLCTLHGQLHGDEVSSSTATTWIGISHFLQSALSVVSEGGLEAQKWKITQQAVITRVRLLLRNASTNGCNQAVII
jgi:hypothetical protein